MGKQLHNSVQDDIEWYEFLCKKFGEKPELDEQGVNPYCEHAYDLEDRLRQENRW